MIIPNGIDAYDSGFCLLLSHNMYIMSRTCNEDVLITKDSSSFYLFGFLANTNSHVRSIFFSSYFYHIFKHRKAFI